jgi:phosphatidylglycerophosphate synthase
MVCDRASNALNFLTLAMLYPSIDYLFILCFVLDFGSHYLQFISTACMKATSHKGVEKKVNWLVNLYYSNYPIFAITVGGTEVGAVLLFLNAKMPEMREYIAWNLVVGIFSLILIFKMFVNAN